MSSGLKPMKPGPFPMGFAPYLMTIGLKGMDPKAGSIAPPTKLFSPNTEGRSEEAEGMPLGRGGGRILKSAVPDGSMLGTLRYTEGYHRCRTFVSHVQAYPNQAEQWEGPAALHELHTATRSCSRS